MASASESKEAIFVVVVLSQNYSDLVTSKRNAKMAFAIYGDKRRQDFGW